MKYDVIIWDIDGTLLDTSKGLINSYDLIINKYNLVLPKDYNKTNLIGPTPQTIFKELFHQDNEISQILTNEFREYYKSHELYNATPYNGMLDVLSNLQKRGYKLGIATNKRQDYATDICKYFKIDSYCLAIFGTDPCSKIQKYQLIEKNLEFFKSSNAIMIGDTQGDLNAAKIAKIDFLGVNYGFGFKHQNGYINRITDILKIIK